MRRIFRSDNNCDNNMCASCDAMCFDDECCVGNDYRRHEFYGGHHTQGCTDCICQRCGCRDMTVQCREDCRRGGGGSCLFWAVLAVFTGGLALIIPLLFDSKINPGGCRTQCYAICRRCGHIQDVC